MGNEVGTVAGAVGTAATGIAAAATFGQVPAVNRAVVDTASYTADKAKKTGIRHGAETLGAVVATSACAVGSAVTLGQNESMNRATVACANHAGNSGLNYLDTVVQGVNPLNAPSQVASVFDGGYARDLPDDIRRWLATRALKCYSDKPTFRIACECRPLGNFADAVLYTHPKTKKTCLAIRGTDNVAKWAENVTLILSLDVVLSKIVEEFCDHARKMGVDYVTGHSLGGYMAEAVASRTGIPGAAFCSPGGRSRCVFGRKWSKKTRFEVHLNAGDVVSCYRQDDHIADPKWHKYRQDCGPLGGPRHSMKGMRHEFR